MDAPPPLPLSIRLRLAAAWAAVASEDLWARLWLPACVLAVFVAVALTDVLSALPGWLHLIVLLAAAGGLGFLLVRALKGFTWPRRASAQTRLEQTSATAHRPLTAVADAPAAPLSPAQESLWRLHQARARASLNTLTSAWPRPIVAARDRLTIRAGALLVLFIAVVGSWGDIGPRLARAVNPTLGGSIDGLSVKIWITPPAYTGRSPIFVEVPGEAAPDVLEVPERSKLLVVVMGSERDTTVHVDQTKTTLEKLTDASQRLEQDLPPGETLEVRQRGRTLGAWRLKPLPDLPPRIAFAADPREAGRWRLRLDYKAGDDYGVVGVRGRITFTPPVGADLVEHPEPPFEFDVAAPPFAPKDVTSVSLHDLTSHPWAGQQVNVQLIAVDQGGQSSESDVRTVTLPEREFKHPVAQALIAIRKGLLLDPQSTARAALGKLSAILQAPQSFGGDARVHLELSTAKYRLAYQGAIEASKTLPPILWAAAVRIEDGSLAVAERNLDDAERAVQEAMERGASPAEMERLLAELQRAIAEYARELASRMPEQEMTFLNADPDAQSVGPEDIARMMQELRQMTQMGAQDAARRKLAELQNMLQALRSAATASSDNPDVKAAQEIMNDLKSLTAEQSKLLEETFKQLRDAQARAQEDENARPSAAQQQQQARATEQQEKLRQKLGELMGRMAEAAGQVPRSMGEAEGEMRESRDALEEGALKPSTDAQGQAVAKLQAGMREAGEQLMQALAEKGMSGMMAMPGGTGGNDPLGRGNRGGPDENAQVDLPEQPDANSMAERVRAILDEIRRRAADRTRPSDEQDYLRRLMKQF